MQQMEIQFLPWATKTKLVKLLRAKGYDVPSIRQVVFDRQHLVFVLHWTNKGEIPHWVYYAWTGVPTLQVDKTWIELTMAEVIQFGLYKEKKIPHGCGRSHTGPVLKEYNKDIFILAQENEFGKGVAEKT